jgi:hypothetical protein
MHADGYYRSVTLVRSGTPHDLDTLQARAGELDATLAAQDAEIARIRIDLAAFKLRYRQEVGLLHEELDELEAAIEEAELALITGEIMGRTESAPTPAPADTSGGSAPRLTSDAVRRLFKDVARAVHPDLAQDDLGRDRRHRLMVEANRAYELGDAERLRWILDQWHRSPEAVPGDDLAAARLRLERRLTQLEEQIDACAIELSELRESPIWKLKTMVDEAAATGKDLVGDMVRRLQRDIQAARNRLDAIRLGS